MPEPCPICRNPSNAGSPTFRGRKEVTVRGEIISNDDRGPMVGSLGCAPASDGYFCWWPSLPERQSDNSGEQGQGASQEHRVRRDPRHGSLPQDNDVRVTEPVLATPTPVW